MEQRGQIQTSFSPPLSTKSGFVRTPRVRCLSGSASLAMCTISCVALWTLAGTTTLGEGQGMIHIRQPEIQTVLCSVDFSGKWISFPLLNPCPLRSFVPELDLIISPSFSANSRERRISE